MERVRAWMTNEVLSVSPETAVREAFVAMAKRQIRHVLVQEDDGALRGIVSSHDLARVFLRENQPGGLDLRTCAVEEIMTPSPLQAVSPSMSLPEAAGLLYEHRIGALPVIEDGRVVGILTTADLLRTFLADEGARR